ncbi:MAG: sensor histidine kinase [Lachnospiraceae bacterium]
MKKRRGRNILFQFKSIQTTILLSFFVLILSAVLLFLIISLKYTTESIVDNSTTYTSQLTEQVNNDIDSYIAYMENISQMITYNMDVQNYLFQEETDTDAQASQYGRVISQFKTIMSTRKDICNVAVVGNSGKTIINRGTSILNPYASISEKSWYQEAKKKTREDRKEFALSTSHVQNVVAGNYDWVITLSRGLINRKTDRIEGVLFVDLNYNTINDLCKKVSLGKKGYIYVMDEKGNIIYHPQQQLLYSGLKSEEIHKVLEKVGENTSFIEPRGEDAKVFTMSKSKETGWIVVGVSYMSELMEGTNQAKIIYIVMTVCLLLAAVYIAAALSRAITHPIKLLDKSMKEMEKGHFDMVKIDMEENNEIGRLGNSFNVMSCEIKNLMEQNIEEQKQKRKAEMRALQAQIQPHFLYNTLDSIIWMAESGKNNQEVVVMTSSLAKLLRRSIGNEDELVTIAQELEYTETYLTIQRIRYKDKLEFDIQVAPEILSEKIVKITLQPLVENAIYHGIKYTDGIGILKIRGWAEENQIILQVIDNGPGMDQEELAHIFEKRPKSSKSNGVGIYNVQNRLQLYYGKEYGLFYESKIQNGTSVMIRIPKIEEADDHEAK